jgi:hypothetical protein
MANWFDPDILSKAERKATQSPLEAAAGVDEFGSYAEINRTGAMPGSLE